MSIVNFDKINDSLLSHNSKFELAEIYDLNFFIKLFFSTIILENENNFGQTPSYTFFTINPEATKIFSSESVTKVKKDVYFLYKNFDLCVENYFRKNSLVYVFSNLSKVFSKHFLCLLDEKQRL